MLESGYLEADACWPRGCCGWGWGLSVRGCGVVRSVLPCPGNDEPWCCPVEVGGLEPDGWEPDAGS